LSNTTPSGATSILSTIDPNDIESLHSKRCICSSNLWF
jgi:hypothetical protein